MNQIKFKILILLGLVLVFKVGISSIIAGAVEIPLIDIKTNLGPYDGNHKYYIHIFNVDDTAKAIVNGNLIKTVNYREDSGWVEITNYLSKGENTIEFNLQNGPQYWTYGFELKQDESNIIWRDSCGSNAVRPSTGCKDNDQTGGLVYRNIITLKSSSLYITKTASPYSIKQGQTTTVTLTIKNTGTTDITNIEVMDSIHRNFDLIGGDFPNPRKFDIIGKGESREIQYMIKSKEGGTFNLDPATGIYADKDGNIQEAKSEPFSVKVITYFEPNPIKTSAPASTPEPTTNPVKTASVSLYGEKTDVVLGEDILLKLSAVNLITKPTMHVQVIIIPPSGMSVTSSEFSKIAAGQFTANYELPPGDGRDIEVSIKSNQIGDFNVNGRIIYYFGDEKGTAEDHNLNLPIKVRKEIGSDSVQTQTPAQKSIPGFKLFTGISGLFLLAAILKRKR